MFQRDLSPGSPDSWRDKADAVLRAAAGQLANSDMVTHESDSVIAYTYVAIAETYRKLANDAERT